jgi:GNAT superfamily N-acetyltransferase
MLRVAGRRDIPELNEMLVKAFDHDPVLRWVLRDDERYYNALYKLLKYILDESIPYGETIVTEELDACAVWTPPGVWSKPPSLLETIRMLPETLSWTGWSRLKRFMVLDSAEYAKKPSVPHFYLVLIGVDPARQGTGLGSKLLEHTLLRLDESGMPAYLENSNPVNEPLYQRHSFRVIDEIKQPDGPSEWCMWRDPVTKQ